MHGTLELLQWALPFILDRKSRTARSLKYQKHLKKRIILAWQLYYGVTCATMLLKKMEKITMFLLILPARPIIWASLYRQISLNKNYRSLTVALKRLAPATVRTENWMNVCTQNFLPITQLIFAAIRY